MILRRRHRTDVVVVIVAVNLVTIALLLELAAIITLEAFLHLRLGSCDDTVIVFRVLQIVLGHDAIAGALGIPCECRVFFGYVLGRATDLNIGTGAVVGCGLAIAAFAVEIVIIISATATAVIVVATTPPAALVLLSWPHQLLT